jgi:uroporphyrinogen-III synthase
VGVVLITRPEPGATETAGRLAASGHRPLLAPATVVQTMACAPAGLERIGATVLTSRNAVPPCPDLCHGRPAFAVGDATALLARRAGFTDVHSASGNAADLAALVANAMPADRGPLFLPAGHLQGQDLARDLRHRGFRVIRRVVYRTRPAVALPDPVQAELMAGRVDAALFFSAGTAAHFVRLARAAGLVESLGTVDAVAISDRATMPLRALPWRRIGVAAKPDQDAMLALLQ